MNDQAKSKQKPVNFKEILEKSKIIFNEKKAAKTSIISENLIRTSQKESLNIIYGVHKTPFGLALLAKTEESIANLLFVPGSEDNIVHKFLNTWGKANLTRNESDTQPLIEKIFYSKESLYNIKFLVTGTDFQIKVWQALLGIPEGQVLSYSDISKYINLPAANRAVGTAIGQNPIHYLIPCHRVIRNNGDLGNFAGGVGTKQALLEYEINSSSLHGKKSLIDKNSYSKD